MHLLFHPTSHANPIALFGLTLLLGLIGGELAARSYFLPRITGYIIVGFLVGPSVFNMVTPSLLAGARIFIEISLGLILFDLGRHLDFTWLRHDRGIMLMSIAESSLTFILALSILFAFQIPLLYAALAASIIATTSPAVVMMVADDLNSKGPVTRRTLILTSLNNLFGLVTFTILLPFLRTTPPHILIESIVYRLIGSILLGIAIFLLVLGIAYLIGKRKENQFILFIGSVMFAIGGAVMLNLSSMLTLFTLGVAARNFNYKYLLTEVDFGWLAKLFFILLFVITGAHIQLNGLWQATGIVLLILCARMLAKISGIWLFAKYSRLTNQQAWALGSALTPMAGLAIGMSNIIFDLAPNLGYQLMTIITTIVAILTIIGPIATQLAFIKSEEALLQNS